MPAPQFHLTFGELVARHPEIRPAMRLAVAAEPVYTHLGSIFHDLPYYGNMILEAIRYGFRRLNAQKKNGPPSSAVSSPTGTSVAPSADRAAVSARVRNAAPIRNDAGINTR